MNNVSLLIFAIIYCPIICHSQSFCPDAPNVDACDIRAGITYEPLPYGTTDCNGNVIEGDVIGTIFSDLCATNALEVIYVNDCTGESELCYVDINRIGYISRPCPDLAPITVCELNTFAPPSNITKSDGCGEVEFVSSGGFYQGDCNGGTYNLFYQCVSSFDECFCFDPFDNCFVEVIPESTPTIDCPDITIDSSDILTFTPPNAFVTTECGETGVALGVPGIYNAECGTLEVAYNYQASCGSISADCIIYVGENTTTCNDQDPCTDDTLDDFTCDCIFTPIPDCNVCGLDCDDLDCTTEDTLDVDICECIYTPITPPDCDDLDPCTVDSYDLVTCDCLNQPIDLICLSNIDCPDIPSIEPCDIAEGFVFTPPPLIYSCNGVDIEVEGIVDRQPSRCVSAGVSFRYEYVCWDFPLTCFVNILPLEILEIECPNFPPITLCEALSYEPQVVERIDECGSSIVYQPTITFYGGNCNAGAQLITTYLTTESVCRPSFECGVEIVLAQDLPTIDCPDVTIEASDISTYMPPDAFVTTECGETNVAAGTLGTYNAECGTLEVAYNYQAFCGNISADCIFSVAGDATNCDDDNCYTEDIYNAETCECEYFDIAIDCFDNDCTTTDSLNPNTCECEFTPITAETCDDSNPCTNDFFSGETCDCVNEIIPNCNDCVCTDEYDPVCGSDGVTYSNACQAECEGVTWTVGECDDCVCTQEYDPVCGSDGMTYSNSCFAACAGVTWTVGECDDCVCTQEYDPVCGSDGMTYSNSCFADCVGVTWTAGDCNVCDLECDDGDCNTDDVLDPVACECSYTPITPPTCDDDDCSTDDSYDSNTCDCIYLPIEQAPCDDGDCSTMDVYDESICNCVYTSISDTNCDDGLCYTNDYFDPATCQCINEVIDEVSCDDENCATEGIYNYETCECEYDTICDNVDEGGEIGPVQGNCAPFDPDPIGSIEEASGGCGTIEYLWASSDMNIPFSIGAGSLWQFLYTETGTTLDPPFIDATMCYVRCARVEGCDEYAAESNVICITIGEVLECDDHDCRTDDVFNPETCECIYKVIAAPECDDNDCSTIGIFNPITCECEYETMCSNVTFGGSIGNNQESCGPFEADKIENLETPYGGCGEIEYLWVSSPINVPFTALSTVSPWQIIDGADEECIDPGFVTETTYFIRCARTSSCEQWIGESNTICIEVESSQNCDDGNCLTLDEFNSETCECEHVTFVPPNCDDSNCATSDSFDPMTCECTYVADNSGCEFFVCPSDITVSCLSDYSYSIPTIDLACGASGNIDVQGPDLEEGSDGCDGAIYTITYYGTDGCGNTQDCIQRIQLVKSDIILHCPSDVTVSSLSHFVPGHVTLTGCEDGLSVTVGDPILVEGMLECNGLIYQVPYTATGLCGFTQTCTQVVTVGLPSGQEYSKIGDFVWNDLNANGIQDDGPMSIVGLDGFVVSLQDASGNDVYDVHGNIITKQTTSGGGKYCFEKVPMGSYKLKFTPVPSFGAINWSPLGLGNDDDIDSDVSPMSGSDMAMTDIIELTCHQDYISIDAGVIVSLSSGLARFEARYYANKKAVQLDWNMITTVGTKFYEIERSFNSTNDFESIHRDEYRFDNSDYRFMDTDVENGDYYYRLKTIDQEGRVHYSEVRIVQVRQVRKYQVGIYPNPTNDILYLEFDIINEKNIQFEVFDIIGNKVEIDGGLSEDNIYSLSARSLIPGIYFVKMKIGNEVITKRFSKL